MNPPSPPGDADDVHPGVAVGVVERIDDPRGLGRVKVRFPWRATDGESYWARVAAPMAGDEMGAYFLPEEDDEVLVAFDSGDIDHPYVLGGLWSGEQPPPEDNSDGENDVRRIRSRSDHELVLDDGSGGKVEITTGGGHTIMLEDGPGGERITIEDSSGGNTIEFDAVQGSLSIESGGTLTIEAAALELTGDGSVKIESSGILTLEGSLITLN